MADPTWALINSSNKIVYADFCVVDKVEYIGTVKNSNKTWQVLICNQVYTIINKLEKVSKILETQI